MYHTGIPKVILGRTGKAMSLMCGRLKVLVSYCEKKVEKLVCVVERKSPSTESNLYWVD